MQLVLLIVDGLIYYPFVKLQDEEYQVRFLYMVKNLTKKLQEMEEQNDNSELLKMPGDLGQTANLLVNDLEDAVNKKQLFLLYQPQFHGDGSCIGAEALLRWKHPQAGLIYPPLIIVFDKEGGFLPKLEEFIFDEACKTLSEIEKQSGDNFKISVNITGESLKNEKFEETLNHCIQKYHIAPNKLWIEITEQDALASTSEIVQKLNRLKANGHKLLIDDFGMGHTSINYLQTNLFDVVKLDGCITRTVLENSRNQDIISSIVYLSQSLNFMIISEYVENANQRDKLEELGCDVFQGYLYSKPVPLDEFMKFTKPKS